MSQLIVERVLGRLLTDEGLRHRFAADREGVLAELLEIGCELNPCELRAFRAIDPLRLQKLANHLDPCIQKVELAPRGGADRAPGRAPAASRMSIEALSLRLPGGRDPQREPADFEGEDES